MMKYYKVKDNLLILNDSSKTDLLMPYIAGILTAISLFIQIINQWPLDFDIITILTVLVFIACLVLLIWAYYKKTIYHQVLIEQIAMIKQVKLSNTGFYLELKNGKQRDLSQIKSEESAITLLELLRAINPNISTNFSEKQIKA